MSIIASIVVVRPDSWCFLVSFAIDAFWAAFLRRLSLFISIDGKAPAELKEET